MAKPIANGTFETETMAGAAAGPGLSPFASGGAAADTPRPRSGCRPAPPCALAAAATARAGAASPRRVPACATGMAGDIGRLICFTPGTRILTRHGERPIDSLRPGDLVVTRDHGLRPVRWLGRRRVPGTGSLAPVVIDAGATGGESAALTVSPRHRMLFTGYRAELLFGEPEVLVTAAHLVNGRDVRRAPRSEVTYMHLMFDRHEVIYAEGMATESFYAGEGALSAVDAPAREELFTVFPELRSAAGEHRITARPCLRRHEAQLLVAAQGGA